MHSATILVVSGEPLTEAIVRHLLPGPTFQVNRTEHPDQVLALVEDLRPRLLVVDVPVVEETTGATLCEWQAAAGVPLVVMTPVPETLAGQLGPSARVLGRPPEMTALGHALQQPLVEPPPPAVSRRRQVFTVAASVLLVVMALLLLLPVLGVPGMESMNLIQRFLAKDESGPDSPPLVVKLVPGQPDTFELPEEVVQRMNIPAPVQIREAQPRILTLSGSLGFNPDKLAKIQSRFAGEVYEIGTSEEPKPSYRSDQVETPDKYGSNVPRPSRQPLRYGSRVTKDQVMAMVWSKELGEKKSELVEARAQYTLDRETRVRLEKLYESGGTSEAVVRQARRNESASYNALLKARRTLLTWRLNKAEIDAIEAEAKDIIARKDLIDPKGVREQERVKEWARVKVFAPFDGIVVEKNVVPGQFIDTTTDLFKVADLSELAVLANVYEEDLADLRKRKRDEDGRIPWEVQLTADPSVPLITRGITRVGPIIDPTQHTALVMGLVNNTEGRLNVGQFVSAKIELDPPEDVVSVPTRALDEDGKDSCVLVQPDPKKPRFVLKRVVVTQRFPDMAYVKSRLDDREKKRGLSELRVGEWVVVGGAVQLRAGLEEARARAKLGK